MAAKKKKPKDERPQSERFIDAAKMSGADESGSVFEKAFRKMKIKSPSKTVKKR